MHVLEVWIIHLLINYSDYKWKNIKKNIFCHTWYFVDSHPPSDTIMQERDTLILYCFRQKSITMGWNQYRNDALKIFSTTSTNHTNSHACTPTHALMQELWDQFSPAYIPIQSYTQNTKSLQNETHINNRLTLSLMSVFVSTKISNSHLICTISSCHIFCV